MTKQVSDTSIDACLSDAAAATELYLCTGNPTTRAAAIAASLNAVVTPGATTGPQDSAGSGREIIYAAVPDIDIIAAGQIDTVVQCTASELKIRTDLATPLIVAINDTVDLGQFLHAVRDPQ